jgi:hypothetical protein
MSELFSFQTPRIYVKYPDPVLSSIMGVLHLQEINRLFSFFIWPNLALMSTLCLATLQCGCQNVRPTKLILFSALVSCMFAPFI